jgi:hypothetical protein
MASSAGPPQGPTPRAHAHAVCCLMSSTPIADQLRQSEAGACRAIGAKVRDPLMMWRPCCATRCRDARGAARRPGVASSGRADVQRTGAPLPIADMVRHDLLLAVPVTVCYVNHGTHLNPVSSIITGP